MNKKINKINKKLIFLVISIFFIKNIYSVNLKSNDIKIIKFFNKDKIEIENPFGSYKKIKEALKKENFNKNRKFNFYEDINQESNIFYFLINENEIIGLINGEKKEELLKIEYLEIIECFQGMGFGSFLINKLIEDELISNSNLLIYLWSPYENIEYYKKIKFNDGSNLLKKLNPNNNNNLGDYFYKIKSNDNINFINNIFFKYHLGKLKIN